MLQRAISSVGSLWTTRKVSLPAVELVAEMMNPAPSVRDGDGRTAVAGVRGRLAFEDLRWGVDGREILKGVSFTVEPGETVAIVGAGGGGKSSLMRVALRLDAASGGKVLLDGTEVRDIQLDELRRRIGILEQHPAFFARSLRDNLVLDGRTVADDRIRQVAVTCHIAELVDRIGLDKPLPDGGKTLSGSERRRLGLVRLLLRDPDVIFIDELEAGLPQALAQALYRDVRAATAGKTCLMVTHRPDLLTADRVAFIHQGSILDVGAHQELEQRSAQYRSLLAEKREGEER
jgi:ATP-binding cassette subfamily B protein